MCSVEAIQFDCNFGMIRPWAVVTIRYGCDAAVINTCLPTLESVTGDHQTGRSNEDVRYLRIYHQYLPFITEGIGIVFRRLDSLMIHTSSLLSISANDLLPFPRLWYLDLHGNFLTSIGGDLFKYTPNLRFVSFGYNCIEHIGHNLVTNLTSLTFLHFESNVCIGRSASIRDEVLSLAPELSILCPPLEMTVSVTQAEIPETTTEITKCFCDEEINKLLQLNRALRVQVGVLQMTNVEQNKRIEQQSDENQQQTKEIDQQSKEIVKLQQSSEQQLQIIRQLQHDNEQLAQKNAALKKYCWT